MSGNTSIIRSTAVCPLAMAYVSGDREKIVKKRAELKKDKKVKSLPPGEYSLKELSQKKGIMRKRLK